MKGLEGRGARAGERRVARVVERLAEAVREEAPGDVRVAREGPAVVLTGRSLRARAVDDPRLRGLGMLAKDLR